MVELLKNVPIGIDTRDDGVHFNLNLFSKGTKPDYRDDFPITIVRTTGARIEVVNQTSESLSISNIYLGIIVENTLDEVWGSSFFNSDNSRITLNQYERFEMAFEGKQLIGVFDDFHEEKGVIIVSHANRIVRSSCFDGDIVEKELEKLNRNTNPDYQNWDVERYEKLDIKYGKNEIPVELQSLSFDD